MKEELKLSHFDENKDYSQYELLFRDSFPETIGTTACEKIHHNWKFNTFPSEIKPYQFVGYLWNDMVGYYAAIPFKYKVGDKFVNAGMVCDVMTSSKARGKGVFTKMGRYSTSEMAKIGIPFTIGHVIRDTVLPGHLKVGWKIAIKMPLYIKFIRVNALFKSKHLYILSPIGNILFYIYNGLMKSRLNKGYDSMVSNSIDEVIGYDQLIKNWQQEHYVSLCKDLTFAKWRYSAPNRNYKFIGIYDSKKQLVSYAAMRKILRDNIPSYAILDLVILNKYASKISGLIINSIEKEAKKDNVEAILISSTKLMAKQNKLISNGFLRSPFLFKFIVKNLTNEISDDILYNENNWDVHWVDSDDQ